MDPAKPEYFRPALIVGAAAGVLSGLPLIAAGNCLCCLWIVGGGAVGAKLLSARTPGPLRAGDGALVGALAGIVAAVVSAIVEIPLRSFNLKLAQGFLDRFSDSGFEVPAGLEGWFDLGSGAVSPAWMLLGLFVTAAVYAIMGALGGVIGVSLFAKKAGPPAPPPPPAALEGPSDAA
jgi:hypothetical protein